MKKVYIKDEEVNCKLIELAKALAYITAYLRFLDHNSYAEKRIDRGEYEFIDFPEKLPVKQ